MTELNLPRILSKQGGGYVNDPLEWMEVNEADLRTWKTEEKTKTIAFISKYKTEIQDIEQEIRRSFHSSFWEMPIGQNSIYLTRSNGEEAKCWGVYCSSTPSDIGQLVIEDTELALNGSLARIRDIYSSPTARYATITVTHDGSEAMEIVLLDLNKIGGDCILKRIMTDNLSTIAWVSEDQFFYTTFHECDPIIHSVYVDDETQIINISLPSFDANFAIETSPDLRWIKLTAYSLEDGTLRVFISENQNELKFKEVEGFDLNESRPSGWSTTGHWLVVKSQNNGRKLLHINCENQEVSTQYDDEYLVGSQTNARGQSLLVLRKQQGDILFKHLNYDGRLFDLSTESGQSLQDWTIDKTSQNALVMTEKWHQSTRLLEYDFSKRTFSVLREAARKLSVRHEFHEVISDDGTVVPVTLLIPDDYSGSKAIPCMLQGYGGFGLGLRPMCLTWLTPWFQNGGMVAIAHVRGGDERGADWHDAGKANNKINSFIDFICVAKWLAEKKYTSRDRLCTWGASFGGTLALGAAVLAPDRFAACIAHNPITDIAKFGKLNSRNSWIDEFGDTLNNETALHNAAKWSPLHNIKMNLSYPDTLILVGENDQRVSPIHSAKMIKALKIANPEGVTFLHELENSGHYELGVFEQALIQHFAMYVTRR